MYKVFFNDHILAFRVRSKNLPKDNKAQVIEIESFEEFMTMYPAFDFMKLVDNLDVVCSQPEKVWKAFRKSLVEITAAGGLVKNPNSEILFIKRLGKWDLPKGKIEKGESFEQAAIREVEEECGLHGHQILKKMPSTFHLYYSPYLKTGGNLVLKETHWFEMFYEGDEKPIPQFSEDIELVKWFHKNNLHDVYESTYKNLVELLDSYLG